MIRPKIRKFSIRVSVYFDIIDYTNEKELIEFIIVIENLKYYKNISINCINDNNGYYIIESVFEKLQNLKSYAEKE